MRRLKLDVIRGVVLGCVFAAGLVFPVLQAQQPSPTDSVLRGVVVDATTGGPLRRARVSAGTETLVFTDDQGRFSTPIPSGAGPLRVTKAGYVAAVFATRVPEPERRIQLVRGAAINGRIVDRYGHPTENTFITAVLQTPADDRAPAASRQFFAQVDALGEYRLAGLPPGRFQLRAMKTREWRTPPVNLSREELLFGNGPYVDVSSENVDIALRSGDDLQDVDFRAPGEPPTCGPNESLRPGPGVVRGVIRGRVVGAAGEPVPCARVIVSSPTASVAPGESDEQGFYTIYGLPAGTFSLSASASGYVLPVNRSTSITLRAGEERERVDFALQRLGIITGTVVDEHGEALEGIRMVAFDTRRYGTGYLVPPAHPGEPTTDDRGRYRIIGLQPGRYLVAAHANGDVSGAGASPSTGYAPIYYPNSPDLTAAVPVAIEPGQELRGIDVGFVPTPTFSVSGRVFERQGPVPAQVTLALSARAGIASVLTRSADVPGDGTFVFRNVPPGEYVLQAQERPVSDNGPFGIAYVRVTDADPQPASLMMVERSTIEGRLVLETSSDLQSLNLSLGARSDDPDTDGQRRSPLPRELRAEGVGTPNRSPVRTLSGDRVVDRSTSYLMESTFRISGLTGRNRFMFSSAGCPTCYIKSASVNGVDAADQPFDVGLTGQSLTGVEVVISDKGAIIEGRVLDEREAALENVTVVVFSSLRDRWYYGSAYVRTARSAKDGSFTVRGVPPGEYLAGLISPGTQLDTALTDAAFLDPLMTRAQRLTVRESDHQSITLRRPRP